MQSPFEIRTDLLRVLDRAAPYALPEPRLADEFPALAAADLAEHLGWLLDQRLAGRLTDRLGGVKWFIKEAGQTALRSL